MNHHTQLDDNIGEANNFRAWKHRTSLILEENYLDQYISKEFLERKGDEVKRRSKRAIADSIKDHLISHVSSLNTPKEVFNATMK